MGKTVENELEELSASDKMKQDFIKVERESTIMSKLINMKSQIDLLQKELNYEVEQLELVKKQSVTEFSQAPRIPPYSTYSNSTFPPHSMYTNYSNAPYWFSSASNNYYQNPYMFGYNNMNEAHSAFNNSLDKADQMCCNEIRNTTQPLSAKTIFSHLNLSDICNLKKVKRNWLHCQPFNNLGNSAGDDKKELDNMKLKTNPKLTDISSHLEHQFGYYTKTNGRDACEYTPVEATTLKKELGSSTSAPHSNLWRVQPANHIQ